MTTKSYWPITAQRLQLPQKSDCSPWYEDTETLFLFQRCKPQEYAYLGSSLQVRGTNRVNVKARSPGQSQKLLKNLICMTLGQNNNILFRSLRTRVSLQIRLNILFPLIHLNNFVKWYVSRLWLSLNSAKLKINLEWQLRRVNGHATCTWHLYKLILNPHPE